MTDWTQDQLRRIGAAEELQIAPVRGNGELRRRTTIWAVRTAEGIYLRAAYGSGSGWHRVALSSRRARIWAGGAEQDVELEDADPSVLDGVDMAYREKYGRRYASIVETINDAEHRASTLRLVPREEA
jgi:hypothetical protein